MLLDDLKKFADEWPVLEFAQVPFNHPLFIMYSSGTTGPPKCMVHSVGVSKSFSIFFCHSKMFCHLKQSKNKIFLDFFFKGTLIQHLKEHILHGNMNREDVIFYYSTVSDINKICKT